MTDTSEIAVARVLSHNVEKNFFILTDAKERFFCGGRFFPEGLTEYQLVSFIPKPPNPGRGKLREVREVLFRSTGEKIPQ
jgi:hypothetical protein